jgi:hypothetical protein
MQDSVTEFSYRGSRLPLTRGTLYVLRVVAFIGKRFLGNSKP